jgi:hypothetical protein
MMTWCSAPHNFRTGSEIVDDLTKNTRVRAEAE